VSGSLARLVFPSLRFRPSSGGFAHERAKIDAALKAGVGGFILFGGDRESIKKLTTDLRAAAGRPLLIGADLERGPRQQVEGLTELPPPAALGWVADLETTNTAGVITGAEARSVGITWAFAPVCDLDNEPQNPIVQTRAFGVEPALVGEHAAAWIRGCQEHGVLACAKHYPGHGRTTQDSHATLPQVRAALSDLEKTDLVPFASAIRAGVGSVMSAFVAYPGWDPSGSAAGYSRVMLDYLRDTLGFQGIVVTDALIMAGATAHQAEAPATASAVAAGCDVLLYPANFAAVVAELDRAVGGVISVARADAALARYQHAVDTWGQGPEQGQPDLAAHASYADRLASRVTHMVRGEAPAIAPPFAVTIVDDDVGGPYKVGPRDVFQKALSEAGLAVATGKGEEGRGKRIVLVYAEPRSWKGRADLGSRSLSALKRLAPNAALIILFGHPRLAAQIPGKAPVVCCWHGQPLMQRAAARWVIERST
jgi:beta-glucosidase